MAITLRVNFTIPQKYRYALICSIEAYGKLHIIFNDYDSSGGGRSLPYDQTTHALIFLGHTMNFIDN